MKRMPELFRGKPEEASKIFNETVIQFKHTSFILDRSYPSSLVYSKVYKRKADLSYVEEIERELNPLVVILSADIKELLRRRRDEIITPKNLKKIAVEYRTLASSRGYKFINTSYLNPKGVCKEILRTIASVGV